MHASSSAIRVTFSAGSMRRQVETALRAPAEYSGGKGTRRRRSKIGSDAAGARRAALAGPQPRSQLQVIRFQVRQVFGQPLSSCRDTTLRRGFGAQMKRPCSPPLHRSCATINYGCHREAGGDDLEVVRTLLREYAAYLNASVGEEHICLENYEKEFRRCLALPGTQRRYLVGERRR